MAKQTSRIFNFYYRYLPIAPLARAEASRMLPSCDGFDSHTSNTPGACLTLCIGIVAYVQHSEGRLRTHNPDWASYVEPARMIGNDLDRQRIQEAFLNRPCLLFFNGMTIKGVCSTPKKA
jgi:hypothetical protein